MSVTEGFIEFVPERAEKKKRNEYQNKWRREHPERVKQYAVDYWTKKLAKLAEEKKCD